MDVIERSRVEVPGHVTRPFQVYLNGVLQQEGRDFRQEGNALVFDRPLEEEGRLSIEDTVEKHLAEFKGQMLQKSKTAQETPAFAR